MRLADYPRGLNRSKINDLMDGWPPYSDSEVSQNNLAVNVSFPENGPNVAHDARRQLDNALLLPDPLFTVKLDYGPKWKRQEWSYELTKGMNKLMKDSAPYVDIQKGVNSLNVSHGIGPTIWTNKYSWCPIDRGIEDVLIPSDTALSMLNLPFFAVFQKYTAVELYKITHGPNVDPGWNKDAVEAAIKWVDGRAQMLMSSSWPEVWSPEKMEDRIKQDGGLFASDAVPTIDTFHFYWWDDSSKSSGWRKKIILDAWAGTQTGGIGGTVINTPHKEHGRYGMFKTEFLYDSGRRKVADKLANIIHFQIANCSSKAPFKYHSVRSLGFLLYAVCHLQNRLQCKFSEATFESLMQYFRVSNLTDAERAMKINLVDKTPIPDGVQFVPQEQRWKVDAQIVQMCMQVNRQSINDSGSSYTEDMDFGNAQETATRTMAKVNRSAAMVSGMTNQAYTNKKFQYMEICRRFCISGSRDPDVRRFRVNMLKLGIPEQALNSDRWDVQPTRVLGSGNKMLQSAMVDRAMTVYTKLDPQAQRKVLRMKLATDLDDYTLAQDLVPEEPHISDSVHDAQLSAGVMLAGTQLGLKQGVNHSEYIEAMLVAMGSKVEEIKQRGGVCTPQELQGFQNLAGMTVDGQPIKGNGIYNHIQILAQDAEQPAEKGTPSDNTVKEMVKHYHDTLKNLMNEVRAFAERMMEQQKQLAASSQNGGMDPEAAAKVQAIEIHAQAKAKNIEEAHAQRTAQRQIQFEQQTDQLQQEHQQEIQMQAEKNALEIQRQAQELEAQRLQAEQAAQQPAKPNES